MSRLEKNEKREKKSFFAAANSGEGFKSFYGEIFSEERLERRYLIKGGAGSGKSSLMRRIADMARERGAEVEYYYCSSDPESLDGVIIGGRAALIDSTPPHAVEPALAGAVDEIVDTGRFWNSSMLSLRREEISALTAQKSEKYRGAYRYLEGALAIDRRARELAESLINRQKLRGAAERMLASVPRGDGFYRRIGIRRAIGMKGKGCLESYERMAKKLYSVSSELCAGGFFTEEILRAAERKGIGVRVSYDPLNTAVPDAVLLEESGIAFVVGGDSEDADGAVNMKRFINCPSESAEARKEIRRAIKARDALVDYACERLAEAGEAHFGLERLYGAAMDFFAESEFCESLGREVLKRFTL